MGDTRAELHVVLGVAEEVDDLGELLLGLVDSGDVGERDPGARRLVPLRARAAEVAEHSAGRARRPPHQQDEEADEEERRPEADAGGSPTTPRCR